MHARVRALSGSPDEVAAGIRAFRERVVPSLLPRPGFAAAYLLFDHATGQALTITFWRTDEDRERGEVPATELRARARQIIAATQPPTVDVYEVAVAT